MAGTLEITLNKLNEIIEQQAKRIKELETEVQKLGDGIESMNNKWVKIRRRLEADLANYFEMAAKSYTACGNYQQRIGELEAEMQEVSNQLIELYNQCNKTTEPEVYGTILGLHERLEQTLKGE